MRENMKTIFGCENGEKHEACDYDCDDYNIDADDADDDDDVDGDEHFSYFVSHTSYMAIF
jgi:hypothetical protein